MMETKLQLLDNALKALSHTTTWRDFRGNMDGHDLEIRRIIVRKLVRDKYVDVLNGAVLVPADYEAGYKDDFKIQRNVEGDLFLEQGGYVQQKINNEKEKKRLNDLEILHSQQAARLNRLTLLVGIGAVGLVVFEIIKFLFERHILGGCGN